MVTGIILAGGNSTRMGSEKGMVELHGRCMIEHVIEAVKAVTDELCIIANNSEYRKFGLTVFSDIIKNSGPLGGIYTGLIHSQTEKNLVISCDMPFITQKFLKLLVRHSAGMEITVPVHNSGIEPLCGIYEKKCADRLKKLLLNKELKISDVLKNFSLKKVNVSSSKYYSEELFKNINSPLELSMAKKFLDENKN